MKSPQNIHTYIQKPKEHTHIHSKAQRTHTHTFKSPKNIYTYIQKLKEHSHMCIILKLIGKHNTCTHKHTHI